MQRLFPLTVSMTVTGLLLGMLLVMTTQLGRAQESSSDVGLWMTPLGFSFGPVSLGDISDPQRITLVNVGETTIPGFVPYAPADSQFRLTATCPDGLAPGASCTYDVRFAPTRQGRSSSTSTTETSVAVFTFSMSGMGIPPAQHYAAHVLDFGALPVGAQSAVLTVPVRNIGHIPISGFTNPRPSDAQFVTGNGCAETLVNPGGNGPTATTSGKDTESPPWYFRRDDLLPGAQCAYTIDFRPTRTGRATAHFTPTSSAGTMDIQVMGWASPAFRVDARALDFGKVISGAVSGSLSVTLENLTVIPLTDIRLTAPVDASFHITSTCDDTLPPGTTCTLLHTFAPTRTGVVDDITTLSFKPAGLGTTEVIPIGLRGAGCQSEACSMTPVTVNTPALDMGTSAVGTQSASSAFTITNHSPYTAAFTGSTVSDPQFLVTRTCGSTLPPGERCTGRVRMRPVRPGPATAQADTTYELVDADDSLVLTGTVSVIVQGFGIPGFTYSPRAIDFPPTGIGKSAEPITVTIRSLGSMLAGFDGIGAPEPFTSTTDCTAGVPAFGTCHEIIRFTPVSSSRYTITRGVGTSLGLYELIISGEGKGAGLWATPTVLNFGTITVGTTSPAQLVTITNVGLAPMTFAAPPLPESNQYVLQSDCPESLAPAATCALTYRFKPTAAGSRDTKASIGTSGGMRTIDLWGYAVEAPFIEPSYRIYLPSARAD